MLLRNAVVSLPAMVSAPPIADIPLEDGVTSRMSSMGRSAKRLLGWNPRPPEEAIIATADSLVRLKLLET